MTRLLLLSGSSEASTLARELGPRDDVTVVRSLAGVTRTPADLPGEVRTGGFGGVDGLASYLRETGVDLLVDATHPSPCRCRGTRPRRRRGAARPGCACCARRGPPSPATTGVACPTSRRWRARSTTIGSRRPFLALGRMALAAVGPLPGREVLVRSVEPVEQAPFAIAASVVARGPFALDDELALLREHDVDAVVTRNSGGTAAAAKIEAARRLGLPVVVIDRPPQPDGPVATTTAERAGLDRRHPAPDEPPVASVDGAGTSAPAAGRPTRRVSPARPRAAEGRPSGWRRSPCR